MNPRELNSFSSAIRFKQYRVDNKFKHESIDTKFKQQGVGTGQEISTVPQSKPLIRKSSSVTTRHRDQHAKYFSIMTTPTFPRSKTSISMNTVPFKKLQKGETDKSLLNISIGLLKKSNLTNRPTQAIKSHVTQVIQKQTKQSKEQLCVCLRQHHKFFQKVNEALAQALVLVGKISLYEPKQLILDDGTNSLSINPCNRNNSISRNNSVSRSNSISRSNQFNRSKNDMGILLYGKIKIRNQSQFYAHTSKDCQTLFEHKFIRKDQSYAYFGETVTDCAILWISRQNYYMVRRQSFLTMDLKYKFHEFEHLLKFHLVNKKMLKIQEKWKFFERGEIQVQPVLPF